MKIAYQGYYGAENSGDDAFVEVASWGAHNYWGADDHLFFASQLPKIKTSADFFSAHKGYLSFLKAIKEIFMADVFVSAGGSTFHSSLSKTDLRTYAGLKKNIINKGVCGAIGISLGPFKNSEAEKNTLNYLKKLDFLALRDRHSYNLACSYNLPYQPIDAFDLAALLPNIYGIDDNIPKESVEKIIGISVCNYERYVKNGSLNKEEQRNKYFNDLLLKLSKFENVKIRFFVFNGNRLNGDEELTRDCINELAKSGFNNYEIIPYLNDVKATWNKIKECDAMISTRLHASIFACFAKIPFFLVEYHRKCSDFLDDVGQDEKYRLYDGEVESEKIANEVYDILFKAEYISPINVEIASEKALYNFTKSLSSIS